MKQPKPSKGNNPWSQTSVSRAEPSNRYIHEKRQHYSHRIQHKVTKEEISDELQLRNNPPSPPPSPTHSSSSSEYSIPTHNIHIDTPHIQLPPPTPQKPFGLDNFLEFPPLGSTSTHPHHTLTSKIPPHDYRKVAVNNKKPSPSPHLTSDTSLEWPRVLSSSPPLQPNPSIVEAAMAKGTSHLETVRLLVLGAPCRGKSTTVSSLRRHDFVEQRISTRGVELNVCYVIPGKSTIDESLQSGLKYRDMFQWHIRTFLKELNANRNHQNKITKSSSDFDASITAARKEDSLLPDELHESVMQKVSESGCLPVNVIPEASVTLRVWDFGGQREYETAHELFISPRSILMFVFSLNNFRDSAKMEEEVTELCRWLLNVFSLTTEFEGKCKPPLLIVGTHRDSCQSAEEVENCFRKMRSQLAKRLPKCICDKWDLQTVTMVAIENRTAVKRLNESGLLRLENELKLCAMDVIRHNPKIPLRWIAFMETLKTENEKNESLFLEQSTIEEMMKGFKFPLYNVNRNEELKNFLLFFRDLGELILFSREESGCDDDQPTDPISSMSPSTEKHRYWVFPEPEKILEALSVIIAPEKVRCEGLQKTEHEELMRIGRLNAEILKVKWGGLPGLRSEKERKVLVNLLIAMDVFVKLEDESLGVPAVLEDGWEDWDWLKSSGRKQEVCAVTKFHDFVPVGVIGTLIARLHRTIGKEGANVRFVRANAVLISVKGRKGEKSWAQVFAGFDFKNSCLHWTVRSDEYDFELLALCLQEFDEHISYRLRERRDPTPYRHYFVAKCPKECRKDGESCQVQFAMPEIGEILRVANEMKSVWSVHRMCTSTVSRISQMCGEVICRNRECSHVVRLEDALSGSAPSETPGPGALREVEYCVFLSHAGEDKELAVLLKKELDERGLTTFVDRLGLQGHRKRAPDRMKKLLRTTSIGVFLLSPEFFGKKWTMFELRSFLERKDAGGEDADKMLLFPIFHRLTYCETSDEKLYKNARYISTFGSHGFFDPCRQKKMNTEQALCAFKKLCMYSGLEKVNREMQSGAFSRNPLGYLCILVWRLFKFIVGICQSDLMLLGVTNRQFIETAADRIERAYQHPIGDDDDEE